MPQNQTWASWECLDHQLTQVRALMSREACPPLPAKRFLGVGLVLGFAPCNAPHHVRAFRLPICLMSFYVPFVCPSTFHLPMYVCLPIYFTFRYVCPST